MTRSGVSITASSTNLSSIASPISATTGSATQRAYQQAVKALEDA